MCTGFRGQVGVVSAVLLLAVVSGCSSEEAGVASPSVPSSSATGLTATPPETESVGSTIYPCELLSADDLPDIAKFDSEYKEERGIRVCFWQHTFENGGDGSVFAVSIRDEENIDSVKDYGDGIKSDEMNQRPAVWTMNSELGDCKFVMKLDDLSRVDIDIAGEDTADSACKIAKGIAVLVEPNLPELP